MAPPDRPSGSSGRRRSIGLFSRTPLSGLAQINTDSANGEEDTDGLEKKISNTRARRNSKFGIGSVSTPALPQIVPASPMSTSGSNSPKLRPRTLQKGRPSSLFGSLGRRSGHNVEEVENGSDIQYSNTLESPIENGHGFDQRASAQLNSKTVLHHGEVQTTSGMFRKKKEYLVLTDTHLIRFKNHARATEAFSTIPPAFGGRSNNTRHPSTTSIGSFKEIQSNTSQTSADFENRIPLEQVVTTYKVEDGRPFFTTEVVYLDEEFHGVGSLQLMLHDPREADLWQTSIRGAAQKARLLMREPYPERVVNYLVRILENLNDYDPEHFQLFRVVRRTATTKGGRSSSDDLQKLGESVFYLIVGINRIHIIPVPDFSKPSGKLVSTKTNRMSLGLVMLVDINVQEHSDDRFDMTFRLPQKMPLRLDLASSATTDIAIVIFKAIQYVKPQWLDYTFTFGGPRRLLEMAEVPPPADEDLEDYGGLDRTLIAYCMAYSCNPSNIQYTVDWEVEDAPEFRLLPPMNATRYSENELLAIMRSLRYNQTFRSISFANNDLHCLHGYHDQYGTDHIAWTARHGMPMSKFKIKSPETTSILMQEIQAIALKSTTLRRMNFANTLPRRRPKDILDAETQEVLVRDPGCEVVAAILPLCRERLTYVTWLNFSGIELGDTDLDELVPACNRPESKLRAIECSRCGFDERSLMQMLGLMERQGETFECVNISGNPGRIDLDRMPVIMSRFERLRKLDLSRITRTKGEAALIAPEVMLTWRLEELILSGLPLNENTLDSISAYLASDMSDSLRILELDQCALTGSHVALLMRSMTRVPGEARYLQLHVSDNRLEIGVGDIAKAIEDNCTPSHLVVRMIDFAKEDHFRQLIDALRKNTTIRSLDISKASLPYDAGPETCDTMRLVFAENKTLEELDISGEHAHLEVTRFGIGLNQALTGLKKNTALRSLRIEYQNLGLEGANTLSSVLEENKSLTHIYLEHNEINLQGFTILVNALARNFSICELPFVYDDQNEAMKKVNASLREANRASMEKKGPVRRMVDHLGPSKPQKQEITPQDLHSVVRVLKDKWNTEADRLAKFLDRNRRIAAGEEGYLVEGDSMLSDETLRPTTAMSDKGILEQVLSNTTPKVELSNPVDMHIRKFRSLSVDDVRIGEENEKLVERDELDDDKDTTPRKPTRHLRDSRDIGSLPKLPAIVRDKMFDLDGEMFAMES